MLGFYQLVFKPPLEQRKSIAILEDYNSRGIFLICFLEQMIKPYEISLDYYWIYETMHRNFGAKLE
jgi:hypothetical protein